MIANLDTMEAPPDGVGSTIRRLTRSLDSTKEGLAMKATSKTCTTCGQTKPLGEFRVNRGNATDGRQGKCIPCERAYNREWSAANRDRLAARRKRNKMRYIHLKWEWNYRRRAIEQGNVPVIIRFTRADLISAYGEACVYCGGPFEQIDHVIPITYGGAHTIDNVRPCCDVCNRKKGPSGKRHAREGQ